MIALTAPAISGADVQNVAFMKANALVMERMMQRMAVPPTGDVDADFVNMMEPHHRGAIEMAELELRHGKNEQLRRLAQEIIISQTQEIVAMRLALNRPLPPAPTSPSRGVDDRSTVEALHHDHPGKDQ